MKLLIPGLLLALCYVIFFGYINASYDRLPPKLATHFDLQGNPNGWMSRDALVEIDEALGIGMPGLLVGLMTGIGVGCLPRQFLNVPNRDYWLAPERREVTAPVLIAFSLWFACMNVLFITGVHWMIVEANSPVAEPHLNLLSLALVSGGFLLGTGTWSILLIRRFKQKP